MPHYMTEFEDSIKNLDPNRVRKSLTRLLLVYLESDAVEIDSKKERQHINATLHDVFRVVDAIQTAQAGSQ